MEEAKPQQKKFKDFTEENKKKIVEKARTDKKYTRKYVGSPKESS